MNIRKKELLFYSAIFCEILAMLIDMTTLPYTFDTDMINLFTKVLRYLGYVIISFKIFDTKYKKKELIIQIAIVAFMVLCAIYAGRAAFCMFLFVYGARKIDFEKLMKVITLWLAIGMVGTLLLSFTGIIENWDYSSGGRMRQALGYFYPSHVSSAFLYTTIAICYVLKERLKFWHVCLIELLNYWQYLYTDSRTGTMVIALAIPCFYLMKFIKKEKNRTILCYWLTPSYVVAAFVSLVAAVNYNSNSLIWVLLNRFTNKRIALAHNAIKTYGIRLFGQNIEWIGNGGLGHIVTSLKGSYNYVDCSYIKILLENGLLFVVFIIIGFTTALLKAAKRKNIYLCFALAVSAMYSIIEPRLIELGFNPFLFVLVVVIDYKGYELDNTTNQWSSHENETKIA